MGLFNFPKKTPVRTLDGPYKDTATNLIYQLLFCDNIDLYKSNTRKPYHYPFDILFSEKTSPTDLQKIIDDDTSDPRIKVLAYNRQIALGEKPTKKELLGVIVEVGLDNGLDVLATFSNGTARYINQAGSVLIWETTDQRSNELTKDLFSECRNIIEKIGPWDKPRRPCPARGNMRISFLVSDGLYFGEGGVDVLFNDPMAKTALATATQLMQYLTERSMQQNK